MQMRLRVPLMLRSVNTMGFLLVVALQNITKTNLSKVLTQQMVKAYIDSRKPMNQMWMPLSKLLEKHLKVHGEPPQGPSVLITYIE